MNLKFAISIIKTERHIHYKAYQDVQKLLYFGLKKLGLDCLITDNYNLKDRRYIFLSAHWLKDYNESSQVEKLIPRNDSIIYNLEQADHNLNFDNNYINLLKNYEVWDFDYENAKRINAKYNLNIYKILEIGFVNDLQTIIHDNLRNKVIDVLFVGGLNERRRKILNQLKVLGIKVKHIFVSYGQDRDLVIAKSKILLNMHSEDLSMHTLEKVRIGYYLNNGCAVVSEESTNQTENMLWGKAICICKYEELAFKALELLNDPSHIARLQVEGLNFFKKRKMEDYLRKVLL
jgi:hypothetical protein